MTLLSNGVRVNTGMRVTRNANDPSSSLFRFVAANARWAQNGDTVAGGNGQGRETNQLSLPMGLFVDDEDTVIVADYANDRIVEWKRGATSGTVLAGGNRQGNRPDQLKSPMDMIFDKETDSLIICDAGNRRVTRWPRRSGSGSGETIIDNIACYQGGKCRLGTSAPQHLVGTGALFWYLPGTSVPGGAGVVTGHLGTPKF